MSFFVKSNCIFALLSCLLLFLYIYSEEQINDDDSGCKGVSRYFVWGYVTGAVLYCTVMKNKFPQLLF